MKKLTILSLITFFASMSFATSKSYELQVNGTYGLPLVGSSGGTNAGLLIADFEDVSLTDITLAGEVYYKYNDQLQIGGLLLLSRIDVLDETLFGVGALARYNLDKDFTNSIFFGGGLRYIDFLGNSNFAILLSAGKRFQISEGFTWTPNATLAINIAGDIDSGTFIALNLLSFSGFLDNPF